MKKGENQVEDQIEDNSVINLCLSNADLDNFFSFAIIHGLIIVLLFSVVLIRKYNILTYLYLIK